MRGVITFVFDDGYDCVFQHVVPLLNELSIPAVFALPLNPTKLASPTTPPLKPWTEWLSIRSHGHEIAAHGITHQDMRTLAPAALSEELEKSHTTLSASTLVYPGGAYNENVIQKAQQHYTAARTTRYGFETIPPRNPWELKTVDYTKDNFALLKANARAIWACLANAWLIEAYHGIYPAGGGVDTIAAAVHHSVRFEEFKKHVLFVKKLPVAIKTIHETISDRHY